VLLLDEPTNDLDLDTLAALEDHLDGFAGTLVVASHDRYVLDRLTDRTLEVDGGRIVEHLDVDAYRAAVHARRAASPAGSAGNAGGAGSGTGRGGSVGSGDGEPARDNRSRQAARRQVRSLEQRLERLTGQRDVLHAEMVAAATDPGRLLALQAELATVEGTIGEVEEAWLAAALAADPAP
jgi:ABC transport system ATP-binding/permease protein